MGSGLAQLHQLLDHSQLRLPWPTERPTEALAKATQASSLDKRHALASPCGLARVGGLPGDADAFGQGRDGVVVQLPVFGEPLSRFAHGSIFPGYGHHLPLRECYLCPQTGCYPSPEKIPWTLSLDD